MPHQFRPVCVGFEATNFVSIAFFGAVLVCSVESCHGRRRGRHCRRKLGVLADDEFFANHMF